MSSYQVAYQLESLPEVAKGLLAHFPHAQKFAFSGGLGAGKTTLIKSLCAELGVQGDVDSPTFSIVNQYRGKDHEILHIDLYRLEKGDEQGVGLEAYFETADGFVFVEWPEKLPEVLTDEFVIVKLVHTAEGRELKAVSL